VVDKLKALRGPSESYIDVILRPVTALDTHCPKCCADPKNYDGAPLKVPMGLTIKPESSDFDWGIGSRLTSDHRNRASR
jgi:hypothetical protein